MNLERRGQCRGRNLEATTGTRAVTAALANCRPGDFLEQGLDGEAGFGAALDRDGQRAPEAADHRKTGGAVELDEAAERAKDVRCRFDTSFGRSAWRRQELHREAPAQPLENRLDPIGGQLHRELLEEAAEDRRIRAGQEGLAFRAKLEQCRRLAGAGVAAGSILADDAIALECGEVRADGVVGEAEGPGELVHRARAPTQQRNQLPACGFQESPLTGSDLHCPVVY